MTSMPLLAVTPGPACLATMTAVRRIAPPPIVERAQRAYALNGRRAALMGAGLFGDPAWDILLDLFLSECEGRALCVTSVCIGSRASSATALRYIGLLRARGLVERIADTHDKRRTYVRLTDHGWRAMSELLVSEVDLDVERSGRRSRAVR